MTSNSNTTPTSPVVDLRALRPVADQGPDLLDLLAQKKTDAWNEADHRDLTTVEAFELFHPQNPHVYEALLTVALAEVRESVRKGTRKPRFTRIWEEVRDQLKRRTTGDDKLMNNNFRSLYSRLIMASEPELAGAWEIRRSPEADAWIAAWMARQAEQNGRAA